MDANVRHSVRDDDEGGAGERERERERDDARRGAVWVRCPRARDDGGAREERDSAREVSNGSRVDEKDDDDSHRTSGDHGARGRRGTREKEESRERRSERSRGRRPRRTRVERERDDDGAFANSGKEKTGSPGVFFRARGRRFGRDGAIVDDSPRTVYRFQFRIG